MTHEEICTEELIKAWQGAAMLTNDLRATFLKATPAAGVVISPLIERAQELIRDIQQLVDARSSALRDTS